MTSTRRLLKRNQVPHIRFGGDMSLHSLLCLAIGACEAFVLAEMLRPGGDDEGFDVPMCILQVAEDAPPSCTVAASNPFILAHRFEKIGRLRWSDFVFALSVLNMPMP